MYMEWFKFLNIKKNVFNLGKFLNINIFLKGIMFLVNLKY